MSAHPDPSLLADWLRDELSPAARQKIAEHLEECDGVCAAVLEGISAQGELGPYRLLRPLGGGGMGKVYKAVHQHLGKVVALKVLTPERMTDPRAIARFQQEMKAAGGLNHPHIVHAYDAGQAGRVYFLAMEYLEGIDLKRLVKRRGPFSAADACEAVRQAAKGLQHAHENGLVHRDIKPSNLMLTREGLVKVLDLGLARLDEADGTPGLTRVGQALGTADYTAPEQLLDSHKVDVRADLYSLGCTLFYLLVGRAPFSGPAYDKQTTMLAHLRNEPPALETLRADVPAGVAAIVGKLLAKKPEERFATPRELAAALKPFCEGSSLASLLSAKTARREDVKVPVTASADTSSEPLIVPRTTQAGPRQREPVPRLTRRRLLWAAIPVALCIPLVAWLVWPTDHGNNGNTPAKPGKSATTTRASEKNVQSPPNKAPEEAPAKEKPATALAQPSKIPPTDPGSLQLVGNWKFAGAEGGRKIEVVCQLRADGSCTLIESVPKIGTWRHADDHLMQFFPNEADRKRKVENVDANSFVLTSAVAGSAASTGLSRRFTRLTDAEYHCCLGVAHMRQKPANTEAALKELDEAVRLNGSFVEGYNERGHVRNAVKDFAGAIADYTRAIELRPNVRLYVNRASIYITKTNPDLDKALLDLDQAIRIDGASAEAYNMRGNLWFARKDFIKAIADYDLAIKLSQDNPVFYANRGNTYLQAGKTELAFKDLARAKALGGTVSIQKPAAPHSRQTEVSIRNKTTENVFVAVAYKQPRGDLAVQGWHALRPEQVQVFRADDDTDMYLRVERPGGREATFAKYTTFLTWPASSERFNVSIEPSDDSVWVLRKGAELSGSETVAKDAALPAGWSQRRFFKAGPGSSAIEVMR